MLITTNYNLKERKEKENYRKINAKLNDKRYNSKLNDWSIKFVCKSNNVG